MSGDEDRDEARASWSTAEVIAAERLERKRGYNDARAGHGPAMFGGPYMVGYRRGRAEIGDPMPYLPPTWSAT